MGWGWITLAELGHLWTFEHSCTYYLGVGVKSGNSIGLTRKSLFSNIWTLHMQIEACHNYMIL